MPANPNPQTVTVVSADRVLIFERFLEPGRGSAPDLDRNFERGPFFLTVDEVA